MGSTATETLTTPGVPVRSSLTFTSLGLMADRSVSAFSRARGVAPPARSATDFARPRSSSSVSPAPPNTVAASFMTPLIPSTGWLTTTIDPESTTPGAPFVSARIGASTASWPRCRVRSLVVTNETGLPGAAAADAGPGAGAAPPEPVAGGRAVDTFVPAGMKTSAGAGVSRKNRTAPEAKSLVLRVMPNRATTMSSAVPSAVSTNPDWYTNSSSLRSTASSRANASPSVLVRLPTLRSVRGAWKLFAW